MPATTTRAYLLTWKEKPAEEGRKEDQRSQRKELKMIPGQFGSKGKGKKSCDVRHPGKTLFRNGKEVR